MTGSALGTLLIQRLDAALGTTLSQQSTIVNRSVQDAILQPGQLERQEAIDQSLVRHQRDTIDRATAQHPEAHVNTKKPASGANLTLHANSNITSSAYTSSATTTLGQAARIILSLLSDQASSMPVQSRTPLITLPPNTALQSGTVSVLAQNLAQALSQALQHSGLFYESHLKNLTQNQYSLSQLQKEPQGLLHTDNRPAHILRSTPLHATEPVNNTQSETPVPRQPTPGVDPATHTIVRQQLEVLADQAIQWRGEVWPGALMDWLIKRDPNHSDNADHAATAADTPWNSQLELQLPGLGNITADVQLHDKTIRLTVHAHSDTLSQLHEHEQALHKQLAKQQLQLTALRLIAS